MFNEGDVLTTSVKKPSDIMKPTMPEKTESLISKFLLT
jgi:hypothetical protein